MSARAYRPRRCSRRWLDGDCPAGVLAILDHPQYADRYTVFYAEPERDAHGDVWLSYIGGTSASTLGISYHDTMRAHEVAAYRYRNKHRYARWSDLPEPVRAMVRADLAEIEAAA